VRGRADEVFDGEAVVMVAAGAARSLCGDELCCAGTAQRNTTWAMGA